MYYAPHKLYRIVRGVSQKDIHGNVIPNDSDPDKVYLCDCFLHHLSTDEKNGYAGVGIYVTSYINLPKRSDINFSDEVLITESDGTKLADGFIADIKHTCGMQFAGENNYTTIYI